MMPPNKARRGGVPATPKVFRRKRPGGIRLSAEMSDALSALVSFSQHDYSWLAQFFSLLFLPFAHEDLAIILGAYIVVNNIMPVGLVVLCIYGGMVASDFVLYGIGAGARYMPWLTRLAVDDRVRTFGDALKRNLFGLVALCRVVPGVVFVAFIACGWTRVPLARFTVASLIVSALYLPLMLCIVVFFGDALDDRVGLWTWPFLICVLVAIGFVRRQVFTFQEPPHPSDANGSNAVARGGDGRRRAPALRSLSRKPVAASFPRGLFCLPIMLNWIGLALRYSSLTLPTIANPRHHTGGLWGDSKSDYLLDVAANERQWIADFVTVTRSTGTRTLYNDLERARQVLRAAGLAFPLIAKPDIGSRGACRLEDATELREYLRGFPKGEKLILQRFVPHAGEATALYARLPGTSRGRLLSLTLGDGEHYRDGRRHITPELEARLDAIARSMREFHFGRFDLRFASVDALMQGEDFSIIEISGISGAFDRAWDPAMPLAEIYRRLVDRQRIMFLIGEKNRARGFEPVGSADVLKSFVRHSQLSRRYPVSA
jgi:membrane protein DedA with SNARE-associated domain